MNRSIFLTGLTALLLFVSSCGPGGSTDGRTDDQTAAYGGGIGGTGGGSETTSTEIQVAMAGGHAPGLERLEVIIEKIELDQISSMGLTTGLWVPVFHGPQSVEILHLIDGIEALISNLPIDPGVYRNIRILFGEATALVDGGWIPLKVRENSQTVILPIGELAMNEGTITRIELDFDPVKSMTGESGYLNENNYRFDPVLLLSGLDSTGSISGRVEPLNIEAEVGAYHAITKKLLAATKVRSDGTFTIPRLPARDKNGHPVLYLVYASAPNYQGQDYFDVSVTAGVESGGYDFFLEPTGLRNRFGGRLGYNIPGNP